MEVLKLRGSRLEVLVPTRMRLFDLAGKFDLEGDLVEAIPRKNHLPLHAQLLVSRLDIRLASPPLPFEPAKDCS